MAVPKSKHKVYMYRNDYNSMCTEVYKHQNIETGGNLFGLWTTSGSAVIHVVLGPGQACKRTSTSFHQDLEYMARVGGFVNKEYMLCHIGEWHSHHKLSLDKPSAGDESTIRRNFPRGVSKFLVVIANIRNGDTIKLSPYFFSDGGQRYEIADCEVLDCDGPFSTDDKIGEKIAEGKERKKKDADSGTSSRNAGNQQNISPNTQRDGNINRLQANQSSSLAGSLTSGSKSNPNSSIPLVTLSTTTTKSNPSSSIPLVTLSRNTTKPNSTSSDSLVNSNSATSNTTSHHVDPSTTNFKPNQSTSDVYKNTSVDQNSSESQDNPSRSVLNDRVQPIDTDNSDFYPPGDQERSSGSTENRTSASQHGTSSGGQTNPDKSKSGDEDTPSERDIALKKIHDQLKHWFGVQSDSKFKFETSRDIPGAIEISFKHNQKYWMVRFPEDFPTKPAKLFYSVWESSASFRECFAFEIVKPLNNDVNILLTIKNACGECKICKKFTKESLSQSDSNARSMEKLAVFVNKLVSELTTTFSDVTALNVNQPLDSSHAILTFNHGHWHWIINLPAEFPEIPAQVFYLPYENSSQKHDALSHGKHSYGPQDLNSLKLIIKAIYSNCSCRRCFDTRNQYR